jgi:two-component system OmpR family response regulator
VPALLLIEDDAEVRNLLCGQLRDARYTVDCVATRSEAEACLARKPYDALVVDALLPDGSGLELARDHATQGVRALVITGHPDAMMALNAAGWSYLMKPFKPGELIDRLQQLLAA